MGDSLPAPKSSSDEGTRLGATTSSKRWIWKGDDEAGPGPAIALAGGRLGAVGVFGSKVGSSFGLITGSDSESVAGKWVGTGNTCGQ